MLLIGQKEIGKILPEEYKKMQPAQWWKAEKTMSRSDVSSNMMALLCIELK